MKTLTLILSLIALGGAALGFSPTSETQADKTPSNEAIIAAQLPSYPLTKCVISGEELDSMGDPINMVVEGRLVRICCKGCAKSLKKDPKAAFAAIDKAVVAAQLKSYPLTRCMVSDEGLDARGKPISYVHGTRLARFCCKGCVRAFKKSPAKFMAQIDEGLIKAQMADYPLNTCLISGEELGADAKSFLYGTRLVRTCCKSCIKAFNKNPAKFVARLDAK